MEDAKDKLIGALIEIIDKLIREIVELKSEIALLKNRKNRGINLPMQLTKDDFYALVFSMTYVGIALMASEGEKWFEDIMVDRTEEVNALETEASRQTFLKFTQTFFDGIPESVESRTAASEAKAEAERLLQQN